MAMDFWKIRNMQMRVGEAQQRAREKRYFKIQAIGGSWMISTSANLMDVVQSNLTEDEADAWLRLLKEGE
jgi:hypothetical protein